MDISLGIGQADVKKSKERKGGWIHGHIDGVEMSRMSSKGQVTIPKNVREWLNLKEGDKVAFVEEEGRVTITKASTIVFNSLANAIACMAEEKGITEKQLMEDLKRVLPTFEHPI